MTGIILGIAAAGILIIRKWDVPLPLDAPKCMGILAAAALEGAAVTGLAEGGTWQEGVLLSVIGGSLLLASVTDLLLCQVYNFTWWPALAAALCMLEMSRCQSSMQASAGAPGEWLGSLLLFASAQLAVFCRMYGKADAYAFCICGMVETAMGMNLVGLLAHMLLAYGILVPVQALRRNIDKRGNLKRPVPFIPYIVAAFWVVLCIGRR